MSDDFDESIYVHPSIDEFQTILDYEQVRRLRRNVEGTKYNNCAFRLCVDWKATANSVTFYHTFISLFQTFTDNNFKGNKTLTEMVVEDMPVRFGVSVQRQLGLTRMQQFGLQAIIAERAAAIQKVVKDQKSPFKMQSFYRFLCSSPEFTLAMHASIRQAYSATFHAFECFLKDFLLASGWVPATTASGKKKKFFARDAATLFPEYVGATVADTFNQPWFRLATEIRNSLSHHRGNITPELIELKAPARGSKVIVDLDELKELFIYLQEFACQLVIAARSQA